MSFAADMGRHSGRATPSLHDATYRQFKEATGGRSTNLLPIPVQTNLATSVRNLVDRDLLPLADNFPNLVLTDETLGAVRTQSEAMIVLGDADAAGIVREEIEVPGLYDNPNVRCLVYRRKGLQSGHPAFLQIHGGGMVANSAESSDSRNVAVAAALGVTIVSVDYRLAPEHPFPAALNDCEAALAWMHTGGLGLAIDTTRIAVGGDSAGGGIAASLCQSVRGTTLAPVFQHLVYPMLDDRTGALGMPVDPNLGTYIWKPEHNRYGWSAYLGTADPEVASPARSRSLAGLPPTWIGVGSLDLFLDENIEYARRLISEGVATELQVYPSAFHGFPFARDAPIAARFESDYLASLARGLGVSTNWREEDWTICQTPRP